MQINSLQSFGRIFTVSNGQISFSGSNSKRVNVYKTEVPADSVIIRGKTDASDADFNTTISAPIFVKSKTALENRAQKTQKAAEAAEKTAADMINESFEITMKAKDAAEEFLDRMHEKRNGMVQLFNNGGNGYSSYRRRNVFAPIVNNPYNPKGFDYKEMIEFGYTDDGIISSSIFLDGDLIYMEEFTRHGKRNVYTKKDNVEIYQEGVKELEDGSVKCDRQIEVIRDQINYYCEGVKELADGTDKYAKRLKYGFCDKISDYEEGVEERDYGPEKCAKKISFHKGELFGCFLDYMQFPSYDYKYAKGVRFELGENSRHDGSEDPDYEKIDPFGFSQSFKYEYCEDFETQSGDNVTSKAKKTAEFTDGVMTSYAEDIVTKEFLKEEACARKITYGQNGMPLNYKEGVEASNDFIVNASGMANFENGAWKKVSK